jgi:hypothetical protein
MQGTSFNPQGARLESDRSSRGCSGRWAPARQDLLSRCKRLPGLSELYLVTELHCGKAHLSTSKSSLMVLSIFLRHSELIVRPATALPVKLLTKAVLREAEERSTSLSLSAKTHRRAHHRPPGGEFCNVMRCFE